MYTHNYFLYPDYLDSAEIALTLASNGVLGPHVCLLFFLFLPHPPSQGC